MRLRGKAARKAGNAPLCWRRRIATATKPKKLPRIWLDKSSIGTRSGGGILGGRIIAGKSIPWSEKLYPEIVLGDSGVFGSHGTLEFSVFSGIAGESRKGILVKIAVGCNSPKETILRLQGLSGPIMEVTREVPPQHQRGGIGTALLREAEKIAMERKAEFIYARTADPYAEKSYQRVGWELIWQYHGGRSRKVLYGKFLR